MSNYGGLEQNRRNVRDDNSEFQRVVYNPVTQVTVYGGGHQERLNRLGRGSDTENWFFPGTIGSGTVRKRSSKIVSKTIKAALVGQANVGELYVNILDHPSQRGPGVMVVPPKASEECARIGAVQLNAVSVASESEYQGLEMTLEVLKHKNFRLDARSSLFYSSCL